METVTATCSRVFSPDISRSILLTIGSQAGQLGNQPHEHLRPYFIPTYTKYTLIEAIYEYHGNPDWGQEYMNKWNVVAAFKEFPV